MSEWQPIETAPKDGTKVDLWCERTHCHGGIDHVRKCDASWGEISDQISGVIYECWRGIGETYSKNRPTHWMLIPTAPEATS